MINIKKKIASEKEKKATNPSPLTRRPSVRSQLLTKGVSILRIIVFHYHVKSLELPELQRNLPSMCNYYVIFGICLCVGTCKLYHPSADNLAFFRLYIQPGNVWIYTTL